MNENQQRHLLVTFQHMDNLLSEAERIMATAGSASPFQEYWQDTTPIQRKVTHDYVARFRETMRRILEELEIPPRQPISGALWAARGRVGFASIAIAEIQPQHMRGYGKLSDEDARKMEKIVAELNADLNRIRDYFAQGATADLQSRIQRLEQTRDEVKLLRELDRIITAHGLVEFRQPLAALLERLESTTFEIGVFGRVSSGKSSLLNYLLEQNVLPVGVTPVTPVPLRIGFGNSPEGIIEFADSTPQQISLNELAEFSSEQQNPSNRKHVSRIQIRFPAKRLRDGVTFVDTPGLGSLATTGAEETVAYLPKCDLGIVLLDAGGSLNHEDLVVVQSLYRAGATAMVLISKVDLLSHKDRERMETYVHQHLLSEVNLALPVHLVSVVGDHAHLCGSWFEHELKPLLDSHREATATSLRRKAGLLREAVVDALHLRLDSARERKTLPQTEESNRAVEELRAARAVLESTERSGRNIAYNFRELVPVATRTIATDIVAFWQDGINSSNVRETVGASLKRFICQKSSIVLQSVERVRSQLSEALRRADVAAGSRNDRAQPSPDELPAPAGLPVFDVASQTQRLALEKPSLALLLGKRALLRFAESRISEQLNESLSEFLKLAGTRLETWHAERLASLRAAFEARAGIYRAVLTQGQPAAITAETEGQVRADLAVLGNWGGSKRD